MAQVRLAPADREAVSTGIRTEREVGAAAIGLRGGGQTDDPGVSGGDCH